MKKLDLNLVGKGAISAPLKRKDYRLELVAGDFPLPNKFSLRDKVGKIKNQGQSLSCVGQSYAYYAELLNFIETGERVELSSRDIYSLIYEPEGGAFAKKGAEKIINSGVVLEKDAISYENSYPPSENFMRWRNDITNEEVENGKTYIALKYVTWDNTSVDLFKRAIVQGNGCVVISWGNNQIWGDGDIALPDNRNQMTWRHQVYLIGYDNNKKAFEVYNSWGKEWGDNGFGWLPYAYAEQGYLTNPITLVDVENGTYVKLVSQLMNIQQQIIDLLKSIINKFKK
jgi:C1A family cysteine protease